VARTFKGGGNRVETDGSYSMFAAIVKEKNNIICDKNKTIDHLREQLHKIEAHRATR
jgi:hypothetical protein